MPKLNPLVSIIVPTLNSEQFLEKCLKSIVNQTYKNIEIIVVDNYSTDKTRKIVSSFRNSYVNKKKISLKLVKKGPERSKQRNSGAEKSRGKYLLFIDSDMEMSSKVVEECIRKIKSSNNIKTIVIPEESIGEGFWVECRKLERSLYLGVDWIEAARFFPRQIFFKMGKYDENLVSGEDWDLSQRARRYGQVDRIDDSITHNEEKKSLVDILKKKYYYARRFHFYTQKKENYQFFHKQTSILERYKLFFSKPSKLFKKPTVGCGVLFLKGCEFGVGLLGYITKKDYIEKEIVRNEGSENQDIKIAFFSSMILEYGGGFEKYLIETAINMTKIYPDTDVTIITLDKNFAKKILFFQTIYFLRGTNESDLARENTNVIKDKLGKSRYIQCKSFLELRNELSNYQLVYSKNEILEAFILKYLVGYKNLPPLIFCCGTTIYYPKPDSFQSKLHNLIYNGPIYKHLTSSVKAFHAKNSSDEKKLKSLFPDKQVIKIYNPFNINEFRKKSKTNRFNFNCNKMKKNILWIGRLTEQKGIDDLVEIIDSFNKTSYKDGLIWNIAGEGDQKNKILKLEERWSNVNYFGHIENDYIASLIEKNDLYISTSKWEGLPNNILEAQALDLPVVAYNIPGVNEVVENFVTGLLAKNVDDFKEQIKLIIDNKYHFRNISTKIESKFNPQKIYYSLYTIFHNLLNN